jgi:zinc transport system permease protein
MGLSAFTDPLFRLPLLVGLLLALFLPPLGALLRLRDEWLAALGLAHLAAASGLGGLALGVPAIVGAALGAAIGATAKSFSHARGNSIYAFMILAGWSATLLLAANTRLGSAMGHALVDGQLYFAGTLHLGMAIGLAAALALAVPWLAPRLIRARFLPQHERANALPAWRWHLGFDLLVAMGMAIGTATLGLMAAFALIFVPPWLAFRVAGSWRATLAICGMGGTLAYLLAFALALALDQPFGPVLVSVLLLAAALFELVWRFGRRERRSAEVVDPRS